MKTNHFLWLLTLLCFPISCAVPDLIIDTNCDIIGPFNIGDEDYYYTWSYKSNRFLKAVRERLSVGIKGEDYTFFHTTAYHNVSPGEMTDVTFKLPIYSALTNRGIYAKIDILNSASNPIKTFNFELRAPQKETINVSNYIREYYVVNDVIVDPDNYRVVPSEKYRFSGFVDYINVDYYYELDLSYLYIDYEGLKEFETCSGYLRYFDYDKLFPYIVKNYKFPEVLIPMEAIYFDKKIAINFANTMFVNQKTLEMSLIPRPGFLPTNHFYLPINKCSQLLDQVFVLEFSNFGYGKSKFSWSMRYTNNRNFLGDCQNSEYCVQGEIVS